MKPSIAYCVLAEARADGITLWRDGGILRYRGPSEAVEKLVRKKHANRQPLNS
jgi:hypothetical protein